MELPGWKQSIINTAWQDGGMVAGKAMYNSFVNKTVTVTTTYKAVNSMGYSAPAVATGGLITGPGTGTSDEIPIWVSNREYVVNAAATARNLSLLNAINYGHLKVPGFAAGGPVSAAPASYSRSTAAPVGSPNVGLSSSALAAAVAGALTGAELRITGGNALADAMYGRLVLAIGRRAGGR
jgi:hypothetical protein